MPKHSNRRPITCGSHGAPKIARGATTMTHKLNHTGTCAVSTDRYWMAVTDTAPPVGVKCNLLTRYGVAIVGVVTASNRPDFAGWEPLARVPWGMLDVCHLPETGTGYKLELRGGKTQYVKQYEAEK